MTVLYADPLEMPEAAGLTDKQLGFVAALMGPAKYDIAAAAKIAGIHPSTGRKWKNTQKVRDFIDAWHVQLLERISLSETRLLSEMAAIAFSNIQDLLEYMTIEEDGNIRHLIKLKDPATLPRQVAASVRELKVTNKANGDQIIELKLHGKDNALRMLGDYYNLFAGDGEEGRKKYGFAGLTLIGDDSLIEAEVDDGSIQEPAIPANPGDS